MPAGFRQRLMERLASLLGDGIDLFTALSRMHDVYARRGDRRARILAAWIMRVREGNDFSRAVEGYLTDSERMLISAGEAAGNLEGGIREAIFATAAMRRIIGLISGGLLYPVIVLLASLGYVEYVGTTMLGAFLSNVPREEWSSSAATLHETAVFLRDYWWLLLVVFFLCGLGVWWSLGNVRRSGFREGFLDRIPPWSVYRIVVSSSFLITLSSMMRSGLAFRDALLSIRELSSPWLGSYIDLILLRLRTGENASGAMHLKIFDQDTRDDIEIYGATTGFEQAMEIIGRRSVERAEAAAERLKAVLGTGSFVVVGLVILWIVATMYDLTDSLS